MTVKQYLSIKDTLTNTTRRLYRGKWQALHNGKWISESQFRAMYQLPTVLNGCKDNPDRRRTFLLD
jgi:hypothetical protein